MSVSRLDVPYRHIHFVNLPFSVQGSTPALEQLFRSQIETRILLIRRPDDLFLTLGRIPLPIGREHFNLEHIIGVDCTQWAYPVLPRLSALSAALERFPLFLVNVHGMLGQDTTTPLTNYLQSKRYILPAFPLLPQNGLWQIDLTYSARMKSLLQGYVNELPIDELLVQGNACHDGALVEQFKRDFPDLIIQDGKVRVCATPPALPPTSIRWLGVPSSMEPGLGRIYDSNKDSIPYSDLPAFFDNSIELATQLLEYVSKSTYAFNRDDERQLLFPKFLRKYLHLNVLTHCGWELQENLVGAHSARATSFQSKKAPPFSEYHDFEALVSRNREYAAKLRFLTRLECGNDDQYDKVLFYDNGYQDELFSLVSGLFPDRIKVVRCVHTGPDMRLYPYDQIQQGERVLVFCDVVNQGSVASAMVRLVAEQYLAIPKGIFGFVVNTKLKRDLLSYTDHEGVRQYVPLRGLLYKALEQVSQSLLLVESDGFAQRLPDVNLSEGFLFFWEMIHHLGNVSVDKYLSREIDVLTERGIVKFEREVPHVIILKDVSRDRGEHIRSLLARIKAVFGSRKYDVMLSNQVLGATAIAEHLRSTLYRRASIRTLSFRDLNSSTIGIDGGSTVLVIDDGANTFHNLQHALAVLTTAGVVAENIDVLVTFSRRVVHAEFRSIIARDRAQCEKYCRRLLVYYPSNLPLYLIPKGTEDGWMYSPAKSHEFALEKVKSDLSWDDELQAAILEYEQDLPRPGSLEGILEGVGGL